MTYIASVTIIQDSFPDSAVKSLGYSSGGGAFGMMIFPPVFEFLIQLYGWRGALLLLGAVNVHLVVCGLLVTPGSARKQTLRSTYISIEDENNITYTIKNYLSFYIIQNPRFPLIIAAHMLNGLVFNGWTIFLVSNGVNKGLSPQMASFLSFSGGLGTLVGRPLIGPIINNCKVTSIQYMLIMALLNAVAFCMDLLANSFWFLAILAFINGFATASLPVITFGATSEILGEARAVEGYSFAWIFYGVGDFIGGFLLGKFLNIEVIV